MRRSITVTDALDDARDALKKGREERHPGGPVAVNNGDWTVEKRCKVDLAVPEKIGHVPPRRKTVPTTANATSEMAGETGHPRPTSDRRTVDFVLLADIVLSLTAGVVLTLPGHVMSRISVITLITALLILMREAQQPDTPRQVRYQG